MPSSFAVIFLLFLSEYKSHFNEINLCIKRISFFIVIVVHEMSLPFHVLSALLGTMNFLKKKMVFCLEQINKILSPLNDIFTNVPQCIPHIQERGVKEN